MFYVPCERAHNTRGRKDGSRVHKRFVHREQTVESTRLSILRARLIGHSEMKAFEAAPDFHWSTGKSTWERLRHVEGQPVN